jgi:hypothetical protein
MEVYWKSLTESRRIGWEKQIMTASFPDFYPNMAQMP